MSLQIMFYFDDLQDRRCDAYESDLLTKVFFVTIFYPLVLWGCMLAAMMIYKDISLVFINILLIIDVLVNSVLKLFFQQDSALGSECWWPLEMPSDATELMVLSGIMFTMLSFKCNWNVSHYGIGTIAFLVQSIVFFRIYSGINTSAQIYAGMLVGMIIGGSGFVVLWYAIIPGFLPLFPNGKMWGYNNNFFQSRFEEFVVRKLDVDDVPE